MKKLVNFTQGQLFTPKYQGTTILGINFAELPVIVLPLSQTYNNFARPTCQTQVMFGLTCGLVWLTCGSMQNVVGL